MLLQLAATAIGRHSQLTSLVAVSSRHQQRATMSWLTGIKGALFGSGSKPGEAEQKGAGKAGAEAESHECTFPDDVAFFEGDCSSCANPCSTHKQIPDYLKIDTESPLLGSMKPYRRHVLFQTPGKFWNNWSPKLEEADTFAGELSAGAKAAGERLGYRIIVTAVDTQPRPDGSAPCPWLGPDQVLVLPDLVTLGPLTGYNAKDALEEFLVNGKPPAGVSLTQHPPWSNPAAAPAPASASGAASGTESGAAPRALLAYVLVCAHKLRDKRCGVAGPMLVEGLETACQERGLRDQVVVLGCSHVGGHKFAGNLIVYGAQGGHWYGRVKPCHLEAVVDKHIVEGSVIKELWRGRMEQ